MARPRNTEIVESQTRIKLMLLKIASQKRVQKGDAVKVAALRAILNTLANEKDSTDQDFIASVKAEIALVAGKA